MDLTIPLTIANLTAIISIFDDKERDLIVAQSSQGDGAMYQRDRIEEGARWACEQFPGDLVEIGCLNGSTTERLAKVALKFGRRVIAIDPWEIGTQNCQGGEYENFCRSIKAYTDDVEVLRLRSDDPRVINFLLDRDVAFAFVDGLHTFAGALGDLRAVKHAGVIALDDTRAMQEVQLALEMFGIEKSTFGRSFVQRPYWRETWIV